MRFERGRWFVAFTVERDVVGSALTRPDVAVGVDLGIKTLATVATGDGETFEVPNPRHLGTSLKKIRRLSRTVSRRQGPDRRTRQGPSNRRLARHVADASFAEIRRQLTYKTAWHGGTLIVADRWFASSKTCSECGAARAKPALSEREWTCMTCGTDHARDVNAAVNLARLAASGAGTAG